GDLVGDPAALAFGRYPGGGLQRALGGIEVGGDLGLQRLGGAFELFEPAEGVDAFAVGGGPVGRRESRSQLPDPRSNMCSIVRLMWSLGQSV
ncbi:MAG: hypothetical protein M3237_22870, partial [Actinomycetota bacterium]|nr:hypothetical protein [Actinomycetota bacterium]